MHGSRAGHTALCKNDLQPCQRSLPLPLYYTHLTRRGLQHAPTHAHTQRKRERETDSIISLELLIEFCVKYDCVTFTIMAYKRCSLFMLLGFHLFFHPGRFLRIFWGVRVRRCILTEPGVSGGRIWRSALDLTLSQTPLQKSVSIQYCCWKRMSKKNKALVSYHKLDALFGEEIVFRMLKRGGIQQEVTAHNVPCVWLAPTPPPRSARQVPGLSQSSLRLLWRAVGWCNVWGIIVWTGRFALTIAYLTVGLGVMCPCLQLNTPSTQRLPWRNRCRVFTGYHPLSGPA